MSAEDIAILKFVLKHLALFLLSSAIVFGMLSFFVVEMLGFGWSDLTWGAVLGMIAASLLIGGWTYISQAERQFNLDKARYWYFTFLSGATSRFPQINTDPYGGVSSKRCYWVGLNVLPGHLSTETVKRTVEGKAAVKLKPIEFGTKLARVSEQENVEFHDDLVAGTLFVYDDEVRFVSRAGAKIFKAADVDTAYWTPQSRHIVILFKDGRESVTFNTQSDYPWVIAAAIYAIAKAGRQPIVTAS